MQLMRFVVAQWLALGCVCAAPPSLSALQDALQGVANDMAAKYNMSIAVAFQSRDTNLSVAAGYTDAGLGMGTPSRRARADDIYVWGSTTKMFTAPAVLQLVERGVVKLSDAVATHIDPILLHLNGTTLSQHFGDWIAAVQIQHLLHMTSGIADYDGANYTLDQFSSRSRSFGPIEILSEYVSREPQWQPGAQQGYCSTNYILLGLVLARHAHEPGALWTWQGYNQFSVIPSALRNEYWRSEFIDRGLCKEYTVVHGFMESYEGLDIPFQDVWNISCVGGWTAGNYIGPVTDVAKFTYDLYNRRQPKVVSAASQAILTNFTAPPSPWSPKPFKFYGVGTFSLDWSVGDAEAYGHVGDTYGYQSQSTYFPELDFALAVATNVETKSQAQPGDATCIAYHQVAAVLKGIAAPTCHFSVPHRFIGTCNCSSELFV